jgi:phosphatidylinositol alpha 1,6-mannosyltransferase
MRIAIITESFLPSINGVTNSVIRILEHLERVGDEAIVITPNRDGTPKTFAGAKIKTTLSIQTQNIKSLGLPMGLPQRRMQHLIEGFDPDVIHLASPLIMGGYVAKIAKRLSIPTLSVYQTDIGGFANQNGFSIAQNSLRKYLYKLHSNTDRTLAPSSQSCIELLEAGVPNVYLWQRGVDSDLYNPEKRSPYLYKHFRGTNQNKIVIGYVGRLAAEKRVQDLQVLDRLSNIQLVIAGDGGQREKLERVLPNAKFLGFKTGNELAEVYANLDLFIHPGPNETFCQSVQEALASGVPCIVPTEGAAKELITDQKTGYIVDTKNPIELMRTVEFHTRRIDQKQMRIAARNSVVARSWSEVNKQLREHYKQLIEIKVAADLQKQQSNSISAVNAGSVA